MNCQTSTPSQVPLAHPPNQEETSGKAAVALSAALAPCANDSPAAVRRTDAAASTPITGLSTRMTPPFTPTQKKSPLGFEGALSHPLHNAAHHNPTANVLILSTVTERSALALPFSTSTVCGVSIALPEAENVP